MSTDTPSTALPDSSPVNAVDAAPETVTGPISAHMPGCACCSDKSSLPTDTGFITANAAGSGPASVQFAPGTATVEDLVDYMTVGYWSFATGGDWTDGAVWDISEDRVLTYDVSMLSEAGANLARLAFDTWASVVNLTFVEQTGNADIRFSDAQDGAFSFFDAVVLTEEGTPHSVQSAFINVSRRWLLDNGTEPDSFSFQTYLHEIGHALGLGHVGPYNSINSDFGGDAIFNIDSWQMSVMSYFDQVEAGVGTLSGLRTPMLADALALQRLYGLAENETGDTVYGFGATAEGDVFDATTGNRRDAYLIHDTGGVDTLDYSGFSQNQVLDLSPQGISNVGGGRGNVITGPQTTIERAITGSGNDTIYATDATRFIDGGAGTDRADFSRATDAVSIDLEQASTDLTLAGIEILAGTSGNDVLLGNNANLVFIGGAGNDTIDGRGGADTVSFAEDPSAVSVDLAQGRATDGFGDTDTIANVRNVIGSTQGDTIRGDGNDNRLIGGLGSDVLIGGDGDDVLISYADDPTNAGGDNDSLQGGAGNDILRVAGGTDTANGGAGDDLITALANAASDRFSLLGGSGNDTITGSDAEDAINGGQGNDTLNGEDGQDRILAGAGDDIASGGRGADFLAGGSGHDRLDGGAGADLLQGGRNDDTLIGGAGDDSLNGGADDDTLSGGAGADTLLGGRGNDTGRGGAGNDTLNGALGDDDLSGGSGNDTLSGGGGRDVLRGESGNDTLLGQGGDDLIAGQSGNDLLNGASGNDQLLGGQGADTLNGGSGTDRLEGGSGNDRLSGQGGRDTFVFNADEAGSDTVTDFTAGETLVFDGFGYANRSSATDDFSQTGTDVVFQRGDVRITFENADLETVLDAVILDGGSSSVSALIARAEPPPAADLSTDLATVFTDLDGWDSLL